MRVHTQNAWGARMNRLYFGDNLTMLREHVEPESVDLIYLDPPFNSDANYNVIFRNGIEPIAEAQAEAFRDTWHWDLPASEAYDDVVRHGRDPAEVLRSLRGWLGTNGLMAYLSMMTARLIEMRTALKPTGSLFLHCDPTASHYLKIILDAVFGHRAFQNEIIWSYRRWPTTANRFQRMHDSILFYSREPGENQFHVLYQEPTESSKKRWKGKKQQATFWDDGSRRPGLELEEDSAGVPLNDVWNIPIIAPVAKERIGYPTQKPLTLLERIIEATTKPGDVVLDPFCGCGTTVEAAQKMGRAWLGIDVTHYAISLIEERLNRANAPKGSYEVFGRPTDLRGAHDLFRRDKHQFQWWASWLLGAQSYKTEKRGADGGVDGKFYFANGPYGTGKIVSSVKGGESIGVSHVRELEGVLRDQKAEMGILITLHEPTQPMRAFAAGAGFVPQSAHGRLPRIQIVTVTDLLDGRMPQMPPMPQAAPGARKISRRKGDSQLELMLTFQGGKREKVKADVDFIDPRFADFG